MVAVCRDDVLGFARIYTNGYPHYRLFLDDVGSVIIGVERVHEDERNIDVVCLVEKFDLAHSQIKERHAVSYFDDGLGADTTHRGTQTAVQLEHSQFAEKLNGFRICEIFVVYDLALSRGGDAIPVSAEQNISALEHTISPGQAKTARVGRGEVEPTYTSFPFALSLR